MFDIGFFELVVIGVVALLVIGPERLPETLRTMALWWGRLKRGIQNTRAEFEQQIGADEVRRQLHNEEIMQRLHSTKDEIARAVKENVHDIQSHLDTNSKTSTTDLAPTTAGIIGEVQSGGSRTDDAPIDGPDTAHNDSIQPEGSSVLDTSTPSTPPKSPADSSHP